MKIDEIQTTRLVLRKFDVDVLNHVHTAYSEEKLREFLGAKTEEEFEKERKRYEGGWTTFNRTFLFFHILLKETRELIGWCGYHTWYTDHDRAEMGYGLFDDKWKQKGFMSEAMEAVLDYGFDEMNLHRVEAFIGEENEASKRTVGKFNFVREGLMREHYFNNGKHEDSLVYSLLRSEYKPGQ
ncbi:MAG: GNAT family N-acetyltransferase [Bacteroidia bacterium]|nr:GNAT family N-acetyltransferase [Bacteroidia bacterium]